MGSALDFLSQYNAEGVIFLNKIVTGDKNWVLHVNTKTKQVIGVGSYCLAKHTKTKVLQTFSARKIMVTVFGMQKEYCLQSSWNVE